MKLLPRERKQRSDFLLENAASLHLGRLFLGWDRKKPFRAKAAKEKKDLLSAKKAKLRKREKSRKKLSPAALPHPIPTPPLPQQKVEEDIRLAICFVSGETLEVLVNVNSTVKDLKHHIKTTCSDSDSSPSLFANGAKLSPDGSLLRNFGVGNDTIVYCLF